MREKPERPVLGGIYAQTGGGKTHLLCSASRYYEPESVLIATIDGFDETLAKFEGVQYLDLIQYSEHLDESMPFLMRHIRANRKKIKFVGLDSISKLAAFYRIVNQI